MEQITIGCYAQALAPRVVTRVEVLLRISALAQYAPHRAQQQLAHQLRPAHRQAKKRLVCVNIFAPHDGVSTRGRKQFLHTHCKSINAGQSTHKGRAALQHGHMGCRLRQMRHQRHRRGAAAYHHHALARIVQPLRPLLRMHQRAGVIGQPFKFRHIALVVAIVARAKMQKIAAHAARRLLAANGQL